MKRNWEDTLRRSATSSSQNLEALGAGCEDCSRGCARGFGRTVAPSRSRVRAPFSYSPSCTYKTDLFGYNLWDWAALVVAVGSLVAAAVVVVKSGRKSCPLLTSASWLAAPRTGASLHQAAKPGLVLCSHVLA